MTAQELYEAEDLGDSFRKLIENASHYNLPDDHMVSVSLELLRYLEEQLETLRRHDEAATQDAIFFRKGMVAAQEQLEALRSAAMHAELCMFAHSDDQGETHVSLPIGDWLPVVEALQAGDSIPASGSKAS